MSEALVFAAGLTPVSTDLGAFVRGRALEPAKVQLVASPMQPAAGPAGGSASKPRTERAIEMEAFVVLERTRVEYVPLPHPNRLIEAIKSGTLWKHVGRHVTSEATATGSVDRGGFGRLSIGMTLRW